MTLDLKELKYDEKGLIPTIVQEYRTKKVLMMAYMNEESLQKTIETGKTWFWSRSRNKFWNKGESSGHFQYVKSMSYDCDGDTLLIQVEQIGVACHTGANSCFFNDIPLQKSGDSAKGEDNMSEGNKEMVSTLVQSGQDNEIGNILDELYQLIVERKEKRPEGSYTTYLFDKGQDKILKKVGEETAEVIIASKSEKREEIIYEVGDLIYHTLVLLGHHDIRIEEVYEELRKRR